MHRTSKPGRHTRGYLPHFDANTLVQHVVFRTFASLPEDVVERLKSSDTRTKAANFDIALDNSSSGAIFLEPEFATLMQDALLYFDADRYDLQAWCIMPNHVHVVLVTDPQVRLGEIVKSWKHSVAWSVNKILGRKGAVFALDYFDRFIRNVRQAETVIHYVENNAVKAGLCASAAQWPWSSAYHRAKGWHPRHDRLPVFLS